MIVLDIDPQAPVPPYEQLRAQVAAAVAGGGLQAGDRLPPIRQLAGDLGLAPGTVARAYAELEADGVVAGRGRHGTVVMQGPRSSERRRQLADAAGSFAALAARLGVGSDEAVAAVRKALDQSGLTT